MNVEGDVTVSAADVTATETDTTVDVELASVVSGAATDLDGSEQLTALTIEFSSLPQDTAAYGSATLLGNVLTVTLNADGTLPDSFGITLPADYSTAGVAGSIVNDGAPITYTVSVTSDEGGEATSAAYDLTVNVEGDLTGSVGDVSYNEDVGSIPLSLTLDVTDIDNSEDVNSITVTFSGLPEGADVNGGSLVNNVWTGSEAELEALTLTNIAADFSDDISGTLTATTDEGGSFTSDFTITGHAQPDGEPDSASALEAVHTVTGNIFANDSDFGEAANAGGLLVTGIAGDTTTSNDVNGDYFDVVTARGGTLKVYTDGDYVYITGPAQTHTDNPDTTAVDEGQTLVDEAVSISYTDGTGPSVSQTLTLNVTDDVPIISDIQDAILPNRGDMSVHGTWNPTFGADGLGTQAIGLALGSDPTGFDYQASELTGGTTIEGATVFKVDVFVTGGTTPQYTFYYFSTYDSVAQAGVLESFNTAPTLSAGIYTFGPDTEFFALTANADGTYTFDLINNEFTRTETADADDAKPGNYNATMYVVGHSFYDDATLPSGASPDITVDGFLGSVDKNVFVNDNGIGVGNGNFENNEVMTFLFAAEQTVVEFGIGKLQADRSVTFEVSVGGQPVQPFTVLGTDPVLVIDATAFALTDFTSLTIKKIADATPPSGFTDDDQVNIDAITYNAQVLIESQDAQYNFQVSITDGDGDIVVSTDELTVNLEGDDPIATGFQMTGTDTTPEVIASSSEVDTITGGTGPNDTVDYSNSILGVTVDLNIVGPNPQSSAGYASGDKLTGIENIIGSDSADTLKGDGGNNILVGGDGADTLDLTSSGSDTLMFRSMAEGGDNVTGFTYDQTLAENDVLDISSILPDAVAGATLDTQLQNYVFIETSGLDTIVKVNAAGTGDPQNGSTYTALVTLEGVTGVTLQQLLDNHQIIT